MRYATAFGSVTLPTKGRLAQEHEIRARAAVHRGFRVDGVLDAWGEGRAPFDANVYQVPFWLTAASESAFETAKEAFNAILGQRDKLHFDTLAADAPRYSFARFERFRVTSRAGTAGLYAPCVAEFRMLNPVLYANLDDTIDSLIAGSSEVTVADAEFGESDDWESSRIFAAVSVAASPTTFTVSSWPGDFRTSRVIVRVEALASNGAQNFKISNDTLGQSLTYAGTLAANGDLWQANGAIGPNRVRTSTDSGSSWANAWPDTSLEATQAPLMELAPGTNEFTVTADGSPNFRVLLLAKPAYGL